MMPFRKVFFWMHLSAGVAAGIFIFLMCVTGALLAFEPNILDFAEREMRYVQIPAENSSRLSVNEIIEKARASKADGKASTITMQNRPDAAAIVAFGREGQVFVDPYSGAIKGEGASGWRGFFRVTEDLHRWLALSGSGRAVGKGINDAANLLFLFLAISGLYIWFPRRLSLVHLRPVVWFRRGVTGKAREFNWHNVIGFWSSLVLIILTATAVVMSYQWANSLLFRLTGNEPPAQQQQQQSPPIQNDAQTANQNLNTVWERATNHTVWKSISLRLPITNDSAIFTIEEGKYWNNMARSSLTINPQTLEVSKWEPYGDQNSGRQLRSWVRFTHTGETGGFIGQLIAFLACVGGAVLVWTGFSLALKRFQNRKSKTSAQN